MVPSGKPSLNHAHQAAHLGNANARARLDLHTSNRTILLIHSSSFKSGLSELCFSNVVNDVRGSFIVDKYLIICQLLFVELSRANDANLSPSTVRREIVRMAVCEKCVNKIINSK